MKSHILLPSKIGESKAEETKFSDEIEKLRTDEELIPFEVCKKIDKSKGSTAGLTNVLEIMNREIKSISTHSEHRPLMLVQTKSETNFYRKNFRANINSVIEKDNYLLDLYLDGGDANSNGGEFANSNERSDQSETTKNINASFDEDSMNRREEIEASIESLELKALMLLNNDEEILKICQAKVKNHFEKLIQSDTEPKGNSEEDLSKFIHCLIKSKQTQAPAVGDLSSFEKSNELVSILSKIQYQLLELTNMK